MSRYGFLLIGTALAATGALEGQAFASRAIALNFTATERAQIAIWIEAADGTFMGTVGADAGRERPRHRQSSRRDADEQRLPLAVRAPRRRAADLGVTGAPPRPARCSSIASSFRAGRRASRRGPARTRRGIRYFCLSFTAESTRKDGLDAVSCASVFNSDKGRFVTSPTEPAVINGVPMNRPMDATSIYPPRRRFRPRASARHDVNPCMHGSDSCRIIPTRRPSPTTCAP